MKKENKRYCDMDKFADSICKNMGLTEDEANKFITLLWSQPQADVDEVVPCGQCKWYGYDTDKGGFCKRSASPSMWRDDTAELKLDDYCSYGERSVSDE